jgi:hypothetical protein
MTIPIGAHVPQEDPLEEARARHTTVVQFFLGSPQSYQGPVVAYAAGPAALAADAAAAGIDLYVHAPYIVNVATTNNRIRIPRQSPVAWWALRWSSVPYSPLSMAACAPVSTASLSSAMDSSER